MDGFELGVMHHLGHRAAAAHGLDHAVLAPGNTFAKVDHLLDVDRGDEHRAAVVGDHIVVLADGDTGHVDCHGGIDLHHTIARADHRDATAVDRVANRFAAVYITTETVDHRAAHLLGGRGIGEDIAPAGNTFETAGNHQYPIVAVDLFDHRGDQVHGRCFIGLGGQQYGT